MTKVAILPEPTPCGEVAYRAISGTRQATAKTAGAALDALTSQLPADDAGTLVIVQSHQPDRFFSAQQQRRLGELMVRWRAARDGGASLPASEKAELDALVEAETMASAERTSASSIRARIGGKTISPSSRRAPPCLDCPPADGPPSPVST